jgi:hypothetical protein
MKFHGSAAKKSQKNPAVARISVETLTVFSFIPVTQMPGIQFSLAEGNGCLRHDL